MAALLLREEKLSTSLTICCSCEAVDRDGANSC
jgi:hypothetical protein